MAAVDGLELTASSGGLGHAGPRLGMARSDGVVAFAAGLQVLFWVEAILTIDSE